MWWTLPFLVFFVLLALFLFLIFQRTTSPTGGVSGSSPATSSAPFEASAERPLEEEEKEEKEEEEEKNEEPTVTTPAAAEVASPSPAQMKAETQKKNQASTKTSVPRKREQVAAGQVLVVGGVDDLAATYAANEKDDRQRAASVAADPGESASLVARHLVASDDEATAERRGDGNVLAAYRRCHGSDVPPPAFVLFYSFNL